MKGLDKVGDPPRTKGGFTFEQLLPRAVVVRQRWPWVELIDPLSERTFYKNVLLVRGETGVCRFRVVAQFVFRPFTRFIAAHVPM